MPRRAPSCAPTGEHESHADPSPLQAGACDMAAPLVKVGQKRRAVLQEVDPNARRRSARGMVSRHDVLLPLARLNCASASSNC